MLFMFKLINFLSNKLSLLLCKTDENEDNFDYYDYYLVGLFSFILYCFVAMVFAYFIGYFPYIFIIIPCLLNIRSQSGGSHAKTQFWCFTVTTLIYIIIGLSTYLNKYYLLLFLLSFVCFTKLDEVPKYTKTATQHTEDKQKFFQLNYIVRLFIVFILNILSIVLYLEGFNFNILNFEIDFSKISCCLSTCVIINRFTLSDLCFNILDKTGKDIEQ